MTDKTIRTFHVPSLSNWLRIARAGTVFHDICNMYNTSTTTSTSEEVIAASHSAVATVSATPEGF